MKAVNRKNRFGSEGNVVISDHFGTHYGAALRNYDRKDSEFCDSFSKRMLIWLARCRLYQGYYLQKPVAWDQTVGYSVVEEEGVFQPMQPLLVYDQLFGVPQGEVYSVAAVRGIPDLAAKGDKSCRNME